MLLLSTTGLERKLLLDVALAATEYSQDRDRQLARLVVSELSEALKRGRR